MATRKAQTFSCTASMRLAPTGYVIPPPHFVASLFDWERPPIAICMLPGSSMSKQPLSCKPLRTTPTFAPWSMMKGPLVHLICNGGTNPPPKRETPAAIPQPRESIVPHGGANSLLTHAYRGERQWHSVGFPASPPFS